MKLFCMVLVLCAAVSGRHLSSKSLRAALIKKMLQDTAEKTYHHGEANDEVNEELEDTDFSFHITKPDIDMNIYTGSSGHVDLKKILEGLAGKLDLKDLLKKVDLKALLKNVDLKDLLKNVDLQGLLKKVVGKRKRDQMRRKDALQQELEDFKFEIEEPKIGMNIYTGSKDKFNYKKIVKQLIKKLGLEDAFKVLKEFLMKLKGTPPPSPPSSSPEPEPTGTTAGTTAGATTGATIDATSPVPGDYFDIADYMN